MRFDSNLYRGTADFYDRYRPPYPAEVFDALRAWVPLLPSSRVLDLACGTGQIAFGLAEYVDAVAAVDQESEFVAFGREKAERLGVENISWIVSPAERLEIDGTFDAVVIGNAFHRLNRRVVIERLVPRLAVGGCVVLLWSWSPWRGEAPWQRTLAALMDRWVGDLNAHDRVPKGWEAAIETTPHRDVLAQAGLDNEGGEEFSTIERWTSRSLIGNIYSTSHLNRDVLGARAAEFENDLRAALLEYSAPDEFIQRQTYKTEVARRTK